VAGSSRRDIAAMFTRDENRALLFLALVAVAGGVVRLVRAAAAAPGAAVLAPVIEGQEIAAQLARVARADSFARPLREGERIDVDVAGVEELDRLPGVGPALARQIVADREANGPFGSLAGLDRVSGIGPAKLRALEPRVRFSGVARITEVQVPKGVAPARRAP
jgi:competence protein ComEA